jgi:hypothetical protein
MCMKSEDRLYTLKKSLDESLCKRKLLLWDDGEVEEECISRQEWRNHSIACWKKDLNICSSQRKSIPRQRFAENSIGASCSAETNHSWTDRLCSCKYMRWTVTFATISFANQTSPEHMGRPGCIGMMMMMMMMLGRDDDACPLTGSMTSK